MLVEKGFEVVYVVPHAKDEFVDGVSIRAVPKATGRLKRMTHSVWAVFRAAFREKGDLYHFHDPELIPIGLLLKLVGKRVIYDVHEDLPRQILSKHWIHSRLRKMISRIADMLERFSAFMFDGIVAVTPEIACRFPKEKTVLVQNFPLKDEHAPISERKNQNNGNVVVYIGSISYIRGVKEMIEAISLLPDSLEVRLVLAGSFSQDSFKSEMMKLKGWNKVQFIGWQSRKQLMDLLVSSRVGLVTFHPVPNHVNSQPNKLFEYMSAGIPLIASDFPKWRSIVLGHQCGLLVNPLKPQEIAEKIQYIIENPLLAEIMGRNGREAVQKHFVWDVEGDKMLELYQTLLGNAKVR